MVVFTLPASPFPLRLRLLLRSVGLPPNFVLTALSHPGVKCERKWIGTDGLAVWLAHGEERECVR